MAVKFKKSDQEQMNKWLSGNKGYTCLFRATRDGCTATKFHSLCNNKGPTVTIIYNTNNSVYGGYTSVSWASTENWQTDGQAFLIRLYQNGNWKPVQLPVSNPSHTIYDASSQGPSFGSGHDLLAFTSTATWNGTYFQSDGYVIPGNAYSANGETSDSITGGSKQLKEIEVYLVEGKTND